MVCSINHIAINLSHILDTRHDLVMEAAMAIFAKRGGVTSSTWYETAIPVSVSMDQKKITLRVVLDSKGGGQTDVIIEVPPSEFQMMLSQMFNADFNTTALAFAKAVVAHNKGKT